MGHGEVRMTWEGPGRRQARGFGYEGRIAPGDPLYGLATPVKTLHHTLRIC